MNYSEVAFYEVDDCWFQFCGYFLSGLPFSDTLPRPSFEAASIRIDKSEAPLPQVTISGGRFDVRNVSLRSLIAVAYKVKENDVVNTPSWIEPLRYDVVAKSATDSFDDKRLMLQTLLTDRFGLAIHAIHRDQKPASAYALLVANKAQLKPIDPPKIGFREL